MTLDYTTLSTEQINRIRTEALKSYSDGITMKEEAEKKISRSLYLIKETEIILEARKDERNV